MADKPTTAPAATSTPPGSATPPATDTGAGTSAPAASTEAKDAEIHSLRAQLAAAQATTAVGQIQAAMTNTVAPIPPAPEGPLITKRDDRNDQEQSLPEATWALLSPEDKKHFHKVTEKPAKLAING